MNTRPIPVLLVLPLLLALSACGNKGPLVLPDEADVAADIETDVVDEPEAGIDGMPPANTDATLDDDTDVDAADVIGDDPLDRGRD